MNCELLTLLLGIAGVSAGAGLIGSLVGLGGGVIVVPALTLLYGVDFRHAVAASLVGIIATSSSAAADFLRRGTANLRIAAFLEAATATGAVAGALLMSNLHPRFLFLLFGAVLGASLVPLLRRREEGEGGGGATGDAAGARLRLEGTFLDESTGQTVSYRARRPWAGLVAMLGAGLLSALLGIGSGPFKVLAMDSLMGLPIKVSTTTSNLMIGVTALASAGIYFLRGDVNPLLAAPCALGALVGAWLGSRLLRRVGGRTVRRVTAVVLAGVAARMIWQGVA